MKPHHTLHPLCSIFPQMSDEEFDALRDDIEQHGQRDAIVLWDGQILDGRHRMQACLALGIEPKFRTVEMTWEEAKAYVLSVNLTRRHLDASQRAIIASRLATLQKGVRSDRQICPSSVTQQEAADSLNVGVTQVKKARKVEDAAAAEVVSEVERGKMSLHKAGKLAAAVPDKAEQAEIVRAGRVDEVLRKALPPEEPPQLPKTNTHHTSANRRTPDARETDRVGLVSPDDPRTVQDGHWYAWSEERNRLLPVSDEDILRRADEIRGQMIVESAASTTPVVEHKTDSVSSKPGKVPTAQQLTTAVGDRVHDGDWQDLWRGKLEKAVEAWGRYKQSLTGKAKVRSMESWEAALTRIETVAHDRGVDAVCDMIQKAIANGWQGWEHETNGSRGGSRISTAVRSNRNWDEEIPEWKPTE